MNFSKKFDEFCKDFGINHKEYSKNGLRVKLEDQLDQWQNKVQSAVGINLLPEREGMTEFHIPLELNNKLYKAKFLFNEFMHLVTS